MPADGPVVLAANHVSFPDFLFVGQALLDRRLVRFMCRADIWDAPLPGKPVGRGMEAMRHIPVDRAAPAAAYLRARSLLREGEAVCVFPEGGISTAYVVRALMPGAVALARETGAPLVPVSVWGSQRLWAQKRALDAPFPKPDLTRGRLVDVRFREPMPVPPDADLAATTTRARPAPARGPRGAPAAPRAPAAAGGVRAVVPGPPRRPRARPGRVVRVRRHAPVGRRTDLGAGNLGSGWWRSDRAVNRDGRTARCGRSSGWRRTP